MPTTEELQKQAADLQRQIDAQKKADAALAKAKETPRAPEVVLSDFMTLVAMRLGNRADLKLLLEEYKAGTHQEPPAPTQ